MAYEIDYLPVGDGEKSGDAIALRFGNLAGPRQEQMVVVIDGGFKESGEALVQHIKQYYNTKRVDIVVSTHPDADHASGLSVVMEQLEVGALFMHKPWEHADKIKNLFKNGQITASGLEATLEKSLQHASELESLATKRKIPVVEPFQGIKSIDRALHVLGPSRQYYESLLALFRETPEPIKSLGVLAPIVKGAEEAVKRIHDFLHIDLLDDDEETTSAENSTSTIILFTIDGHKLLFTGDAGKTALLLAADYASTQSITLTDLFLLGVPHHGSKRNLSSNVLKRIKATRASVSAAKDSKTHPAKKITNALKKQGTSVYVSNRGITLRHSHNAPDRAGWVSATEEPFHEYVEE